MKIGLIQCNVETGKPEENAARILAACRTARERGAALCITPLEAIYGPDCIAGRSGIAEAGDRTLSRMALELQDGPALLCGSPAVRQAALLMANGNLISVPSLFYFKGQRIGLASPAEKAVHEETSAPVDLFVHMHASQFRPGSQEAKERFLSRQAENLRACVLSVNLVGGYGSAIYNGQSVAFDMAGGIAARGKAFAEDCVIVDMDAGAQPERLERPCACQEEEQWLALVLGVSDFIRKAGASSALLGLSGGMDSALVACIAAEALGPEHVSALIMPSPYSSPESETDALALAKNLGISTLTLPIEPLMRVYEGTLAPVLGKFPAREKDLTFENLQARIRGTLLMAAANRSGALLLNTGNKSELAMGYCTLYGDTCGAVSVLGDIFKTRVYQLAAWYCARRGQDIIPRNIFVKAPSAELRPNQKDSDSLPPYEELDPVLKAILDGENTALQESPGARAIEKQMAACRFKIRQCPPALRAG